MQNLEHITEDKFVAYGNRSLAPAETLALQKHIGACEMCRENLTRKFDIAKSVSALRNDFAFDDFWDEPEHLPYEQLALFVDGKLDAVEQEIAESHFAICGECLKDLADLRSFQTIAAAPVLPKKSVETQKKSFWQRFFVFDSIASFAPIAAAVLIAALFGAWLLLRNNQANDEIAQANVNKNTPAPLPPISNVNSIINPSNANALKPEISPQPSVSSTTENLPNNETLLALSDANGQITVDEKGNVKGLENLSPAMQKAVRQSLQTGKVSVSNAADSLGGSGGVLMGGGNAADGIPFALASPIGKVIRENQPILRWKPLKDATGYSVTIVDDKFRVVAESGKINPTEWKPSKTLPRGANYSWQVTATKPDGTETVSPSSPAPQARFRVVEQTMIDEINRLEKSRTRSHLALGVLYANAGLKQEARREFEILVKENPKSALARKLLVSVQGKSK